MSGFDDAVDSTSLAQRQDAGADLGPGVVNRRHGSSPPATARVPLPADEEERLLELDRYGVLDTAPEETFDDLTRLAAFICNAPIALVSLVDAGRQWFKSRYGLSATETSRDISFCTHAILQPELFVVADALADPRFANNPLVTSEPHIRFYAGAPLVTPGGRTVGALCVLDHVPRQLAPEQLDALRVLARQVVVQLELRRNTAELRRAVVERECAERALQEEESVLISFYEGAPMAMGVVERIEDDLRILSANAAGARFLDRELHELPGARASQVGFSPQQVALWTEHLDESQRAGRSVRFEYAADPSSSATPRWFSATVYPVEGRPGDAPRFSYIIEDVTERRLAEQELRDSRAFYSSLVESLPQKVFRKDMEGRFTFANSRFCAELGQPPEAVVGRTDYDFFPSECAAKYRQDDRRVVESGTPLEAVEEHRAPGAGQETSFVHVSKVPIRDDSGRVIGVQGMFEDVTAQRRAELALHESEARFHAFMDHTPAVAFIKDDQGRHVYVNKRFERLFRVRLEDVRGKTDFDLLPEDAAWQTFENDTAVLAADQPVQLVESVPTPDGRPRDWLVMKFPFRDADGRRMLGGVAIDITERESLERRLAEQHALVQKLRAELVQAHVRLAESAVGVERGMAPSFPSRVAAPREC